MTHGNPTPGPWYYDSNGDIFIDTRQQVCCGRGTYDECCGNPDVIGDYDKIAETSPANARLIAAAPDLLAVLREIMEYNGGATTALHDAYVMDRAHAAIAKAEGRE